MTLMRPETAVLSQLLCDLPDTPPATSQPVGSLLVRALGLVEPEPETDFEASVREGHFETYTEYDARLTREGR